MQVLKGGVPRTGMSSAGAGPDRWAPARCGAFCQRSPSSVHRDGRASTSAFRGTTCHSPVGPRSPLCARDAWPAPHKPRQSGQTAPPDGCTEYCTPAASVPEWQPQRRLASTLVHRTLSHGLNGTGDNTTSTSGAHAIATTPHKGSTRSWENNLTNQAPTRGTRRVGRATAPSQSSPAVTM